MFPLIYISLTFSIKGLKFIVIKPVETLHPFVHTGIIRTMYFFLFKVDRLNILSLPRLKTVVCIVFVVLRPRESLLLDNVPYSDTPRNKTGP